MDPKLTAALQSSTAQTLEQFCSLVPLPAGTGNPPSYPVQACVYMTYDGELTKGEFRLLIRGNLLERLAQGFGEEQTPVTQADGEQTAKEMANIICGNVMPYLRGSKAVFHLSPPRIETGSAVAPPSRVDIRAEAVLQYQGGTVEIYVLR